MLQNLSRSCGVQKGKPFTAVFNFSILNEKYVCTQIEFEPFQFSKCAKVLFFLVSCFRHYFRWKNVTPSIAPVEKLKPQTPKASPFAFPRRRSMTLFRNPETKWKLSAMPHLGIALFSFLFFSCAVAASKLKKIKRLFPSEKEHPLSRRGAPC